MITIVQVPTLPSSVSTATYAVQIKEPFCNKCNIPTTDINVAYSIEKKSLVDGFVIATVKVVVTNTSRRCECCESNTFMHIEHFPLAFTATTANNIEIVASDPVISYGDYKCCRPGSYMTEQTIVATIS